MKVGIVVDDWKLPIFKKGLDDNGYRYEAIPALKNTIILKVEFDSRDRIETLVRELNTKAAISRAH
jgi:hypothetical protein